MRGPSASFAGGLADLLRREVEAGILQLVFLNGCSTEPQVQGLLDAGVPAVIAMQPPNGASNVDRRTAVVSTFSEAIAEELRGSGVTVTTLCPGPTVTGFQKRALAEAAPSFPG